MTTWLPPAQLLGERVVLNATEVAYVLGLTFARGERAGEPDPRRVLPLVTSGELIPVDPSQPAHRRTYAVAVVQRYLDKSNRRQSNVVPIAAAS